jgi:hypothetical protein
VGDVIHCDAEQLEVLRIVKLIVDSGSTHIVMDHQDEFNAIAYATEHPTGSGQFLCPAIPKNDNQHRTFLERVIGPARAPLPR